MLCTVSAAPMRAKPLHQSEMVSQMLFGEEAELIRRKGGWLYVKSLYDGYKGWVNSRQLSDTTLELDITVADPLCEAKRDGQSLWLPAGSLCRREWLTDQQASRQTTGSSPYEVAKGFLGAPYLWGGRTLMGFDCSGLVQVVFKVCGKWLPRDAYQQAKCGNSIEFEERQPGQLAFFANQSGKIIHVGVVAPEGKIIHCAGSVHIDTLDSHGILNEETGTYSHRLHSIRAV